MLIRNSFLIALGALMVACASTSVPAATSADFSHVPVVDVDGKATNLAELAKGRVAVVSLWASWCEGCRQEEPALARLHELAVKRGDFVLVSIAIGTSAKEVSDAKLPYPRLIDTGAFAEIGRRRVPTTLVLDGSGRTVYEGGALDRDGLDALTKALAH